MKKNTLFVLTGGVVLLLIVAFAAGVFDRHPSTIDTPELHFKADAITRIDLETPRLSLTVEREGDAWRVTRPLVDRAGANTMRGLLTALEELTPEAVVSTNPERYARYGVDSTGKALTVHTGGDEVHLVIGKLAPDAQSVYLRYEDDPRVFVARGRPPLSSDLDAWRDKSVIDFGSPSVVRRVRVEKEDKTYEVALEDGAWMLHVDGETVPADSVAVVRWISRFIPLRADGFFDDLDADDVRANALEHLAFTLEDGSTRNLWTRIEGKYLSGVTDDSDVVYRLYGHTRVMIYPSSGSLRKK